MSTTKTQRIGIWVIAVFMAVGTIGSFAIIVLGNNNTKADQDRYNTLLNQYKADMAVYQKKQNDKYYPELVKYKALASSFDKASVKQLTSKDIVTGTGTVLTSESSFSAYYIGWNPDGKIFDSSFSDKGDSLVDPIKVTPGGVIEGWSQGVVGMKEGGVRELTIPSDLAYKDVGQGDDIPPNTPLRFIIIVVPSGEIDAEPNPSDELINLYGRLYGAS